MKILLTGSNGFVGKNLSKYLSKYDLTTISRYDFDLRDTTAVNNFFKDKYFDVVVHCAIKGGNRLIEDSKDIVYDNLKLTMNLMLNYRSFGKILHFGSGAELDRSGDIYGHQINMFKKLPDDPYGFSKNIIGRLLYSYDNAYNLRIFNVFAEDEAERRMIKGNIINYLNKQPINIHQDKIMDFMYMGDFFMLVDKYINDKFLPKELDCVYETKYKLSDIANIINNLSDHKVDVNITNSDLGLSYSGWYYDSKIDFIGLDSGIKKVYESLL
jgi:GDP-L-fucose synthase